MVNSMNDSNKCHCNEFQVLIDRKQDGLDLISEQEQAFIDEHGNSCISCQQWLTQTAEITNLAMSLPQFDIPEALTQSILRSVNNERKLSSSFERISWVPLSVVALLSIVLTMPLDSWSGLLSWFIGFAGVYGLKILLNSANTQEQAG